MPTANRRRSQVPQPTSPQPPAAPKSKDPSPEEVAWNALVERASAGDGYPAQMVRRAIQLERDRADIIKKVDACRTLLRSMDTNELLDEDQAEFLDVFYPMKERDSHRDKDDYEATRMARAIARKTGGVS